MDESVEDLLKIAHQRQDLLRLFAGGTFDKRAVEAELDVSRPTLDRVYRELESEGLLTSVGTTYELTSFGTFVCETLERSRRMLEPLSDVQHALSDVPADAGIDRRLLDGADVMQVEEHIPMKPFMKIVEEARDANQIESYSPSLRPYFVESFYSLIEHEGIPTTLVLRDKVVDAVYDNYEAKFEDVLAADHATVYETPINEQYGIIMTDGTVAVPLGDQPMGVKAVISNDTEAAVEWGKEFLDRLTSVEGARQL